MRLSPTPCVTIRPTHSYKFMMNNDNDVFCGLSACGESFGASNAVHLRVPGLHRYISVVRETVDAVGESLHLSDDDRAAVKLAVGEACNNAVEHALGRDDHDGAGQNFVAPVDVCVSVQTGALEIEVTNQGNGFHPRRHRAMPDPLQLQETGRGMALMEMLMDSVEYLSRDGNTVVRLRKRLPEPAPMP